MQAIFAAMSTEVLAGYCKVAEKVAREAGRIIRDSLETRGENFKIETKAAANAAKVDLVTETDRRAEKVIFELMKAELPPDHRYVGEESAFLEAGGVSGLTEAPTWFIDPLDGTTNFCHGYRNVCVSIGLYVNKEPAVGVILNPFTDECFTAWRGGGAYLNGRRLHVGTAKSLHEAVVATTLGSSRDRVYVGRLLARLEHILLSRIHGFRVSGSTALNIANVAAGRLDAYYDHNGYGGPWDVAAGAIMVLEAGGVLSSVSGGPFELSMGKGSMVAGNEAVVGQLVQAIKDADRRKARDRLLLPLASATAALLAAAITALALMARATAKRR